MRLIQITDLHLSDRTDTPAHDALEWAVAEANRQAPDLVAFTGDMTTYGTAESARHFLRAAEALQVPWVFTPGNAELREPGALPVLAPRAARRSLTVAGVRLLLPDTATGTLPEAERRWLREAAAPDAPVAVLTHYPVDVLDEDSRTWAAAWLGDRPVELWLAGHRHFDRSRTVSGCRELITRGLDPDKAFGGPPGISLLERSADGAWSIEPVPWPHERQLLPARTPHSPVGWSIHGDPLETVRETLASDLHVLELRPREPDFDLPATVDALASLRDDRPVYLSWHLPSLTWQPETAAVSGQEAIRRQLDEARACAVDALTVHVPRIVADGMFIDGDQPSQAWHVFLDEFEAMFAGVVGDGACLSIENVHNDPGTPRDRPRRDFGTEAAEYGAWIDAVSERLGHPGRVGAHFDVGHARNNGALGNYQPLGDWYALIGTRITGYHIHQVRPHEVTGKLTNHRDIRDVYDRTVSYAGFLHAWSRGQLNRAPLYIEVRDAAERQRTARLFRQLFADATETVPR